MAPEHRNSLPEARDLTWDDAFFQNDDDSDGIIAVFDFDYDKMVDFTTQVRMMGQFFMVAFFTFNVYMFSFQFYPAIALIPLGIYFLSFAPCLLKQQVRWEVYAKHVAITRDGIRFVRDRHQTGWGYSVTDKGKHSKTVPFDKITDCDIQEPAGNSCLIVPNVLVVVNVDTASSGGERRRHELELSGLVNAHGFKKLVWAMKRAKEVGGSHAYQAPPLQPSMVEMASLPKEIANAMEGKNYSDNQGDIAGLLRDIRDELRQNNELLRHGQNPTSEIV